MARDRKFTIDDLFHTTKKLLLEYGYDGFTISLLADELEVSRGTIYKYYENKDELISEYMLYDMNQFMPNLERIHQTEGFKAKLDLLLHLMFENTDIQQLIEIGKRVPINRNEKVRKNRNDLDKLLLEMYDNLLSFIQEGKKEHYLKPNLPDGLMLGFIFQSIAIPNLYGVPHQEWVRSIKEIICHGMFVDTSVTLEDNQLDLFF